MIKNEIKKIDSNAFKGLDNMIKLDLSENQINELNVGFEGCNNLKIINLEINPIDKNSNSIKNLCSKGINIKF